MNERIPQFYQFGEFRVDTAKRLLWRNGATVSLMPKAFDVLLTLLQNRGQVVTKDDLMTSVWHDTVVEENSLNVNVSALRKIFGEKPEDHRFIVTVPGVGYKFVAEVCETGKPKQSANGLFIEGRKTEPEENMADKTNPPSDLQETPSRRFNSRFFIVFGVLLAAIGVGIWGFTDRFAGTTQIESIAVLPFVNESGDANFDYLSDGLSESVIDRLARLPQLKVIARNSSFKYRGSNLNMEEVANALGVEAIVTGRVAQRGDNLSIRVELIYVRDNRQLWSDSYNRRATDVQAIQSEIAQTVSENLRLRLTGAQEQQLAKRETVNAQAYEMLLKGRFYRNKGGADASKKAIEYFNQAIALDPNYALAYVALSNIYKHLGANGLLDPKEATPKAEAAAFKALELDENLAEAHVAVANLKTNAWQWSEAERQYYRAIELNPNLFTAHAAYSNLLSYTGQHEQAVAEAIRARELNPIMPAVNTNLGQMLYFARRYDEAIEATKKALEFNQDDLSAYGYLGDIYSAKGMHAEAIAAYQKLPTPVDGDPPIDFIYLGAIYARAGEREKAQALLKRVLTSRKYVSPGALAILYAGLGEREQVLAALEKAYAEHDIQLIFLGVDPNFDSLRDDPHFQDLMRRVGLSH